MTSDIPVGTRFGEHDGRHDPFIDGFTQAYERGHSDDWFVAYTASIRQAEQAIVADDTLEADSEMVRNAYILYLRNLFETARAVDRGLRDLIFPPELVQAVLDETGGLITVPIQGGSVEDALEKVTARLATQVDEVDRGRSQLVLDTLIAANLAVFNSQPVQGHFQTDRKPLKEFVSKLAGAHSTMRAAPLSEDI